VKGWVGTASVPGMIFSFLPTDDCLLPTIYSAHATAQQVWIPIVKKKKRIADLCVYVRIEKTGLYTPSTDAKRDPGVGPSQHIDLYAFSSK